MNSQRASRPSLVILQAIGFAVVCLILQTMPAGSAPFCVYVAGGRPICLYQDVRDCVREARRQQGNCTIDPASFVLPATGRPYCLVDNTRVADCDFVDDGDCERAAFRRLGLCVRRNAGAALTRISPLGPDQSDDSPAVRQPPKGKEH